MVRESLLAFVCPLLLAGCMSASVPAAHPQVHVSLGESTGVAVDHLLATMHPQLGLDTTILIASFSELDEIDVSTKLGRLIAEEAAGHLIQRGYRVPEVRLANTLHFRSDGEFILSREVSDLPNSQVDAGVVLTGTISSLGGITYVNFRLIRLRDGIALAAETMELPDRFASR